MLVADDAKAFADAIVRLYHDEALWDRLAAGGRENIRTHFSRDVARSAITRLIAFAQRQRNRPSRAATPATQLRRRLTALSRRVNTRSQTPWPSLRPRVSNLVCGRQAGRGAKPSAVFAQQRLRARTSRESRCA